MVKYVESSTSKKIKVKNTLLIIFKIIFPFRFFSWLKLWIKKKTIKLNDGFCVYLFIEKTNATGHEC